MRYILTKTDSKGKRKIVKRSHDYFGLLIEAKYVKADCLEIYKGNWEFVERVK